MAAAYARGVQDGQGSITVDGVSVAKSGNPFWDGSTYKQNIYAEAYHEDGGGNVDILKSVTVPVNVTNIYNNGRSSVAINSASWVGSNGVYQVTTNNGGSASTTLTGLELISTQRNTSNNRWYGTFAIEADNEEVTRKTIDINSTIMGIALNNIVARSTATVYTFEPSGNVAVSFYITLSNGNTYTRQVSVPYRIID